MPLCIDYIFEWLLKTINSRLPEEKFISLKVGAFLDVRTSKYFILINLFMSSLETIELKKLEKLVTFLI